MKEKSVWQILEDIQQLRQKKLRVVLSKMKKEEIIDAIIDGHEWVDIQNRVMREIEKEELQEEKAQ